MNKIISLRESMKKTGLLIGWGVVAMLVLSLVGIQSVQAAISTQLDFGDTGSEVTELQVFLSSDSSIYPSGLVTGYFGPLTQSGVERFQTREGIVSSGTPLTTGYGRVGPITQSAINVKLAGNTQFTGTGGPTGDVDAPAITNVDVDADNNGASITWTTSQNARGKVYYSTSPIRITQIFDQTGVFVVSGTLAEYDGIARVNHSVNIDNLTSNTTYFYLIIAFDSSNNVSITTPSSFQTTQ